MTMDAAPSPAPQGPVERRFSWRGGLSARLLLLTTLFVVLSALLVLPPTLAAFEEQWLLDRVRAAELASTIAEADPSLKISDRISAELLEGAGVVSVAIQSDGARRLVLEAPREIRTPYLVDLRRQNPGSWLAAPFFTLFSREGSLVRVVAEPQFREAEFVEILTPDAPLKADLLGYLARLAVVTVFVAILAGALVYLSLNRFLVAPMRRITRAMERFRANPEDPRARIELSGRTDEIGRAEAELDRMQADLVAALNSRARLAALGEAVAKINHDLRNMLTSAQIASDRLAAIGDPKVAAALPRLERALDRAVTLATNVLAYGKTDEAAPDARPLPLKAALKAAAEEAGLPTSQVRFATGVDTRVRVMADPDQLHRILANLLRNARQAIEAQPGRKGKIQASLVAEDGVSIIRISDDGPGLPEKAQENLFLPFAGSARRGGTGLGLVIARELAQGHGGELSLIRSSAEGSVFELRLPGAPEPLRGRG
ncbi:sensor histidine kinase [Caulobacter sp. NIBR2454]|uniref:sensor histidine kinase n=1 Tax=Caulobacter sp. NIBR2454 TaxID=3015996 RepID=UPI0022B6BF08|nr:HAMP domain-containing sensor histidine kinase [Caulobacter sp. NIBR2454]